MNAEVIVVGAGVAGLSCASELRRRGAKAVVLERSRGLGGRCATRRVHDQPVDHGVAFLHGRDPGFLRALEAVDATVVEGWPSRVHGQGTPCQPQAFSAGECRLAFAEGLNAFPKHLARELDIRRNTEVRSVAPSNGVWRVSMASGQTLSATSLVLATAGPQMAPILDPLSGSDDLRAARLLVSMSGTHPCLTLLAGYAPSGPSPDWDICYPEHSACVQMIAHDSIKRLYPAATILVYQARPCWSSVNLAAPSSDWAEALLVDAGQQLGEWARRPLWYQAHRWRFARSDRGMELRRPMLMEMASGARLGLAGEIFSPGAGVQAAWLSGQQLAQRLTD